MPGGWGAGLLRAVRPFVLSVCVFGGGCASIPPERDEALNLYAQGRYEEALGKLDAALIKQPDEAALRATQLRIRQEAVARLVARANELRDLQRLDEAAEQLQRAAQIDPRNERLRAINNELARDRRLVSALNAAEEAASNRQIPKALRLIEQALKENPRHAGLLNLQQRLELALRQSQDAELGKLADTRPISLEFRDAPVRSVLDVVGRNSGVNFVFDKDVKNDLKTTVYLKQARIEDALELITSTNQLAMKVLNPKTVLIYPNTAEKTREYQDLLVRVFYLAHADAKQVAAVLKSTLKLRDTQVDERLNTVMIRETPDTIRLAERLVALQDVPDPEVLLDVAVMEISRSRLLEIGIQPPDGFSLTPLPLSGQTSLTWSALTNLNSDRIGVSIGATQVNANGETADVNVLANPKIRAKNKEKAKIMIGDRIPTISSSTNTVSNFVSESIQYQDVGLKLEVEPLIALSDDVQIKVSLEVSNLGKEVRTTNSLAYQIGTRSANTVLKLRDGETQLLAGLISKEDRSSANGLPGLSEMPIVGALFGSQRKNASQTEIVLAITPRIVRNVRLPDLNRTEFWTGSESRIRLRPLALPEEPAAGAEGSAGANATNAAPGATGSTAPSTQAVSGEAAGAPAPDMQGVAVTVMAPAEATPGALLKVPVMLKTGTPIKGVNFNLMVDPAQFEVVEVQAGGLFQKSEAPVSVTSRHDKQSKALVVGIMRTAAQGVTGNDVAVTVVLKPVGKGAGSLEFWGGSAVPESGRPLPIPRGAPMRVEVK